MDDKRNGKPVSIGQIEMPKLAVSLGGMVIVALAAFYGSQSASQRLLSSVEVEVAKLGVMVENTSDAGKFLQASLMAHTALAIHPGAEVRVSRNEDSISTLRDGIAEIRAMLSGLVVSQQELSKQLTVFGTRLDIMDKAPRPP